MARIKAQQLDIESIKVELDKLSSPRIALKVIEQPTEKHDLPVVQKSTKEDAKRNVDDAAERARLRHVTDGIGQSLVYAEKVAQAADFAAAGFPSKEISSYPLVEVQCSVDSCTPKEAANTILHNHSRWLAVCTRIESIRLIAKRDITNNRAYAKIRDEAISTLDNI